MERILQEIKDIVVGGRFREIEAHVEEAIQGGVDLHSLINQAMIAAMDVSFRRDIATPSARNIRGATRCRLQLRFPLE